METITSSSVTSDGKTTSLLPPMLLDQGSIITVKMRGHSRTGGLDYFSVAMVLSQAPIRPDNQGGELELMVFDPSAGGTHYQSSYPMREISSRPSKDGGLELYESSSNIGDILFSPRRFEHMADAFVNIYERMSRLETELSQMQNFMMDVANSVAAQTAAKQEAKEESKSAGTAASATSPSPKPPSGGKEK